MGGEAGGEAASPMMTTGVNPMANTARETMITPYMAMTPGEEEADEKNIIFDEKPRKGSVKKANTVCCTIF